MKTTDASGEKRLEQHLSIRSACTLTSLSRTTIKDALKRREIGFLKVGPGRGRVLIPERELMNWLAKRSTFFPAAETLREDTRS